MSVFTALLVAALVTNHWNLWLLEQLGLLSVTAIVIYVGRNVKNSGTSRLNQVDLTLANSGSLLINCWGEVVHLQVQ
jgi:hypothetical protein